MARKPIKKGTAKAKQAGRKASKRVPARATKPATRPSSKSAAGVDSRWAAKPLTGEWNTAANWTPAVVATDSATFAASARTAIVFAAKSAAKVGGLVFPKGAPTYAFTFTAPAPAENTPTLEITGAGIRNDSAQPQHFVIASTAIGRTYPQLQFSGTASAGGPDVSYSVGPSTPQGAGGGVLRFVDESTAGSASFTVTTGAGTPPKRNSTVGAEVTFSDHASAGTARFTIYGSTSLTDGDTFGNTVFHDSAIAANAVFSNAGGTVAGGDGGNTQFFDDSSADNGVFHNYGATAANGNGGDVAFDGTATGANGSYHNYRATAAGGHGGVTSFNNNPNKYDAPPAVKGASAGNGRYYNYGAEESGQGGGHTEFTAKYGPPTAANGHFYNYGSAVAGGDSESAATAGHTTLTVSIPPSGPVYTPTAGRGTFWNLPGTASGAPGGYTQFAVYTSGDTARKPAAGTKGAKAAAGGPGPTAGDALFINLGGMTPGARGGYTSFSGASTAANARLIAAGGVDGGEGGRVAFYEGSSGGAATVLLFGNGVLDLADHATSLTIGSLDLAGGTIETSVGTVTTSLVLTTALSIDAARASFRFVGTKGVTPGTAYTILTAPNLRSFTPQQFTGNAVNGLTPTFTIVGNDLRVTFGK